MKKALLVLIAILALAGCVHKAPDAQETALQNIIDELVPLLPDSCKVAVIDIAEINTRPAFASDLSLIQESILTRFVRASQQRFTIIERRLVNQAFDELAMQKSDMFDQTNIARLGKFLGVDYILSGTVTYSKGASVFNVRCLQVESLKIVGACRVQF